jgi:hypothetical protein
VPGSNCPTTECPFTTFNANASSTYQSLGTTFNITYGLGSSAGTYGTDVATIGGVSVANQTIGLATTTSSVVSLSANSTSSTNPQAINGILGLAFPSLTDSSTKTNASYNPFVFNLLDQKLITDPVFSVYLSPYNQAGWTGEVTFGGTDSTKYRGEVTYVPVAPLTSQTQGTEYFYWMVYAAGLGVTNSPVQDIQGTVASVAAFIFDTGTTFTYFPTATAQNIFTSMTGSSPLTIDASTGAYIVECSIGSTSSAVFQLKLLSSKTSTANPIILNIPLSDLLIPVGTASDGSTVCTFGIVPQDATVGSGLYIIGDSILRSFYTVYDMSAARIGIAPAVGLNSSVQGGATASASGTSSGSTGAPALSSSTSSSDGHMLQTSIAFVICSILVSVMCM